MGVLPNVDTTFHMYQWVTINIYKWVVEYIWMSHGTCTALMREDDDEWEYFQVGTTFDIYEWVTKYIWMSHGTSTALVR